MLSGLVKDLVEERRQVKVNIHEESRQTVIVYAGGWQSRLNTLKKVVTNAFVLLASVIQGASKVPPVPVSKFQEGNVLQSFARDDVECNAAPVSSRAGSEPETT